jgi:nitronate monooxygenase
MKQRTMSPGPIWNETRISSALAIEYPIIQGPLGGLSTQRLAATVSNNGGLGSFGAHGLAPSAIEDVIGEIRALTSKPFAINLWVSMEDEDAHKSGIEEFGRSLAPLAKHIESLGGILPEYRPYVPIKFEHQVRVLLDAKVPVFSFIYGVPPKEILDECRSKEIVTIGTATTPDEAIVLEQAGVDVIVASGFEAGGHRGSFLLIAEDSLTGTFSLVPQTVDSVSVPVIAAGGIADARGLIAALALGAEGVQIGTAFLACVEAGASALHRDAILNGKARRTSLTRGFTGRLARGIHNQLLEELNRPGVHVLPYPLQRALVKNLSVPAETNARGDFLPLWAGESANLCHQTDAKIFLEALISEVSAIGDAVVRLHRQRRSDTE